MQRNERVSSQDRDRFINIFSDEENPGEGCSANQNFFVVDQPITPTLTQPTIIDYQANEIRSTESQSTAHRIDPLHPVFNNKLLYTVQEPLGSSISQSTMFAAVGKNILQETRRGITVYHPTSVLSESGTQQSNKSNNPGPFQPVLDYGGASALSRQDCAGETRSLSMSSFVPSAHLLSLNQSQNTYQNVNQVPRTLLLEKDSNSLPLDSQNGCDESQKTEFRKENLKKLDKNFHELMQQNSKLEQEIRTMNSQFTKRQNQRIHDLYAAQLKTGPVQVSTSQSESVIGLSKMEMRLDSGGSLVMNNMQSSFDQRCAKTKEIVNQLAQRLSEVKLETSIELDRIQSRQGSASNSNSRSPKPGHKTVKHLRQSSQNSYQQCNEFQTPFGNSNVSLRKVDARHSSRNNLNATENLVEALGDISGIQTGQTNTNNVSVVSTTGGLGGLNFKLLKPQDSIHASLNELHIHLSKSPQTSNPNGRLFGGESEAVSVRETARQEAKVVRTIREQEQEPLMFDNSPVRKSDGSSHFPQKVAHESDLKFEKKYANESNSNFGANVPKKQFNESLMQMIPHRDTAESSLQKKEKNRAENNPRFSFQMEHPRKEEAFEAQKADETRTLSSSNSEQALFELKLQTLGPERSPMNVNGAAQLSNILQQINSANNKTRQEALTDTQYQFSYENPTQNQKTISQMNTISPMVRHQKGINSLNIISPTVSQHVHANFFLSQDNGPSLPLIGSKMLTQSTPTNMPLAQNDQIISEQLIEQETKDDRKSQSNLLKSPLHIDNAFNQLKQNLKVQQNAISRQVKNLVQDSLGNQTTYTLDGMTAQTFEKMHNEVMALQDKIKCLEAKMANSSTRYDVSPTGYGGNGDQKKTLDSAICTVMSERSVLYNHDSKHFQESMDHSVLKMTVPKTVVVQKLFDNQVLSPKQMRKNSNPTVESRGNTAEFEKNNQNDDKEEKTMSYAIQHRPILSQAESYCIMNEKMPVQNRNKSRSQAEQSLQIISEQAQKQNSTHLRDCVVTQKDKKREFNPLPLHRDISDVMSQSQPDLVNLRTRRRDSSKASASAKTLSQIGSRKSSKSKSPISGKKRRQGSTRADQKTLQSKKSMRKNSQGNQITPKLRTRSKSKDLSSLNVELLAISSSKAVSFKADQEEETRIRLSHQQLTDAYVITNSDYTAPSEMAISQRKGSHQQILSPKVMTDCDLQKGRYTDAQQTNVINEKNLSEFALSSSPSNLNQQSLMPKKQSHKQTFPLRIRKNQSFPKGLECPSIPSQSTGADKQNSNSQAFESASASAEAPMLTDMQHRVSQSTQLNESLQDRIIQQYEVQIENQDHQSSMHSRNTPVQLEGLHHSSELAQVQNPLQMTEYLFHQGLPNKDGQTWTNQTSRFQLIGVQGQEEANLSFKKGQYDPEKETLDNEQITHASEEEEQTIEDDQLEMLPFSSKYQAQNEPKQKAKYNQNKDLPLQRQIPKSKQASDQNRAAWLEQRNRHLELELRRHQMHLASTDELHQKYNSLKIDYKQILQSFERSEEIRREQKELINEQQSQIKSLKSKLKKSETTVFDLTKENEQMRLAQSSAHLSQIFSLSKVQQANQSHLLRNSYANRSETQPVSTVYASDTSRSPSQQPSSKVSTTQLSRSQLHNTNYMVTSSTQNLWQPNKDSMQRPSPYTGKIMADQQPNFGTDLMMHEGYSVLFDGTQQNQTRKSLKKSKHRSRSHSERKHKKNHKKKHYRKNKDQSGKKLERSHSNSTSKRSSLYRKSSRPKQQENQSVNQSYVSSVFTSKIEKKDKKRSRSGRGKKKKALKNDLGYIFNIQTQQSDQIKGVHKFESTKGSMVQPDNPRQDRKKRSSSGGRQNKEKSLHK